VLELRGHRGPVVGLAYSPDGLTLASASVDGTARLWDVRDGRLRETLSSTEARAYCVAFSPDGKLLAVGYGRDHGLVQLWERSSLRRIDSWAANSHVTSAISFAPDSRWLVSSGNEPGVQVWSAPFSSGRQIRFRHNIHANCVAFATSSLTFAVLGRWAYSPEVTVWECHGERIRGTKSIRTKGRLNGHCLTFDQFGARIACGLEPNIALIALGESATEEASWPAHDGAVLGVAFLHDSRSLLSAGADGLVKHWYLDGRLIRTIDWRIGELGAVAIAPDGLTAAVGGAEKIVVWDLEP
jgi:WD40 repeat protein